MLGLRVAASLGFASDTYHARSGSSTPKPKAFNQALRFWYFADSGGTVCHPAFLFKCSEPSHLSIGGGFFTYLGCSAVSVVSKRLTNMPFRSRVRALGFSLGSVEQMVAQQQVKDVHAKNTLNITRLGFRIRSFLVLDLRRFGSREREIKRNRDGRTDRLTETQTK